MADREQSSRPPLVLVANDQEWSARSLESILGPNGYAVLRAYTGQQALERARTAQPDLVILDAQMPDIDGIEVCRRLRADDRFSATTPIVITTAGPSGRAQRLDAYRAGAWEFLGQPLDGEALLLKLATYIKSKIEVDRVRDESLLDHLTGLYNMRGLARRAREIGSEAFRRSHGLSCIVFSPDPEDIKNVQELGDEVGRRLVAAVGQALRRAGRASDAIGRLGQLEFAVIAPATGPEETLLLVERLQHSVEAEPIPVDGADRRVQLKAGYCAVPDFRSSSVDAVEMLLRATTALRNLKMDGLAGGGRVRAFEQVPLNWTAAR